MLKVMAKCLWKSSPASRGTPGANLSSPRLAMCSNTARVIHIFGYSHFYFTLLNYDHTSPCTEDVFSLIEAFNSEVTLLLHFNTQIVPSLFSSFIKMSSCSWIIQGEVVNDHFEFWTELQEVANDHQLLALRFCAFLSRVHCWWEVGRWRAERCQRILSLIRY